MTRIIILVIILLGVIVSIEAQEITFGIHIPPMAEIFDNVPGNGSTPVRKKLNQIENYIIFVDSCGYNFLLAEPLNCTGQRFCFPSPVFFGGSTLWDLHYRPEDDSIEQGTVNYFQYLVTKAHEKGITIYAEIQYFGWVADGIVKDGIFYSSLGDTAHGLPLTWGEDTTQFETIIRYLLVDCGADGISEETYSIEWGRITKAICDTYSKGYVHKEGAGYNFEGIPLIPDTMPGGIGTIFHLYGDSLALGTEILSEEYLYWSIGCNDYLYSFCPQLNKPLYIKTGNFAKLTTGTMQNLLLFRAIAQKPQGFFFMQEYPELLNIDAFTIKNRLQNYVNSPPVNKPLFNIIIYLPGIAVDTSDGIPFMELIYTFGPIFNAISASGYEPVVTLEPITDAEGYYIFTRGGWSGLVNTLDLPSSIMAILDDTTKPVFLQVGTGIPVTSNWQTVRNHFGLDNTNYTKLFDVNCIIQEFVTFNGEPFYYSGQDSNFIYVLSIINPSTNILSTAEVLTQTVVNGDTCALIIKKGNHYYFNGSSLHIQASFPVSWLINQTLQSPNNCWLSTSTNYSVFFATDSTDLEVYIPWNPSLIHIVKYDTSSQIVVDSTTIYIPPLTYHLDKGELLVVNQVTGISEENAFNVYPVFLQINSNLFSQSIEIKFKVPCTGHVLLKIYDVTGRLVCILVNQNKPSGSHFAQWDGTDNSGNEARSGVYFCQLEVGDEFSETKKLLFLR